MSNQSTVEELKADLDAMLGQFLALQQQLADTQQELIATQAEVTQYARKLNNQSLTSANNWMQALYGFSILMQQQTTSAPINSSAYEWFERQNRIAEAAIDALRYHLETEELEHAEAAVTDLRTKAIEIAARDLRRQYPHNPISTAMLTIPEMDTALTAWLEQHAPPA